MSIIGFTGTQEGLTLRQKRLVVIRLRELKLKGYFTAIHGDCIGSDEFFGTAAAQLGYRVTIRPGTDKFGNSPKRAYSYSDCERESDPYMIRNHKIVYDSTSMIACPKEMEEELRSGTWATVRYARKVGRPVDIIYPYEE